MPDSHASVSFIRGDMGDGKTNTLVGFIVDRYFQNLYAMRSPRGKEYPCRPLGTDRHRVILMEQGQRERVVYLPDNWVPLSAMKVFVNFHLYGNILHVYCTVADMLRWLNNKTIKDGILGIDESYIEADARQGSKAVNILLSQFNFQLRKRHIHLYLLTQHNRLIDWRYKYIRTEEITCRYDEETRLITLIIKDMRKNKEKRIQYDGSQYWPYFDTDEIPDIPQSTIDKVLEKIEGKKPKLPKGMKGLEVSG